MKKQVMKKQAGGTLLDLILGLIIGLGIAVGVALMISKTPLPFTNKAGAQPERSTQLPPATNDLSDPNKPLYGKKQPKPAEATDPAAPVAPAVTAPAAPVVDKSTLAKEKAQAKVEAAAKAESDEKWIYYLQAGAFRERADAENMKAKLALLGFEASVSAYQADTGALHRVRIGPFGQLETMNRVRGKLSDNGVDVAVVRIGK
jgi:cell division protein FtsN